MLVDFVHCEISYELLLKLLKLEGGVILATQPNIETNTITLRVKHDDITPWECVEGISIQPMQLEYTEHRCGHACDIGEHIEVTREPIRHWGRTLC